MFSGRRTFDPEPRARERRRAERERYERCAEGFEHVRDAAEQSIDPILHHLRHERSPYNKRRRDAH